MATMKIEPLIILVLSLLIISIPLFSTDVLIQFDTLYARILVVFVLLGSVLVTPLTGLLTLTAIGLLYIERNRRKVLNIQHQYGDPMYKNIYDSHYLTTKDEGVPQKNVTVRPFDNPDDDDDVGAWYVPTDDDNGAVLKPIEVSGLDDKQVMEPMPNGEKAGGIFGQ